MEDTIQIFLKEITTITQLTSLYCTLKVMVCQGGQGCGVGGRDMIKIFAREICMESFGAENERQSSKKKGVALPCYTVVSGILRVAL